MVDKYDIFKVAELSPEKKIQFDLKAKRHNELQQATGKVINFNSTNRMVDVFDAIRFGMDVESQKKLLTPASVKKYESLSKPL